jgi:hypothetical protein
MTRSVSLPKQRVRKPEIANVLSLGVCNRLYSQLKSLTNVIERLGGRTELSEVTEKQPTDENKEQGGTGHAANG